MSDDAKREAMIKAVKDAVMVEIKGQQLYTHAAKQTEDPAARTMFEMLARDEDAHVRILTSQYKALMEEGRLDLSEIDPSEVDYGSHEVVNDEFKRSIKRRGTFEMAVIGIGCDLETKAIAYYRQQAENAKDEELGKIFHSLMEWEKGHLKQLLELEKVYQDSYWADQGFSPM